MTKVDQLSTLAFDLPVYLGAMGLHLGTVWMRRDCGEDPAHSTTAMRLGGKETQGHQRTPPSLSQRRRANEHVG